MIQRLACQSCEVEILDRHDPVLAERAKSYSIRVVPAVVIDGKLAARRAGGCPAEAALKVAGIGTPLP